MKDESAKKRAEKIKDMDLHRISFPEFYQRLEISEENSKVGLTQLEAERRNKI